jgi:hypothetical protein
MGSINYLNTSPISVIQSADGGSHGFDAIRD